MIINTKQGLIQAINDSMPQRCCDAEGETDKSDGDVCSTFVGVDYCPIDAAGFRIGKDQIRTETNPTAAGRKKWLPGPDSWLSTENISESVGQIWDSLDDGFYIVQFNPTWSDAQMTVEIVKEKTKTEQIESAEKQQKRAIKREVHQAILRRAEIDNEALESAAAATREAYRLVAEGQKALIEGVENLRRQQNEIFEQSMKMMADLRAAAPQKSAAEVIFEQGRMLVQEIKEGVGQLAMIQDAREQRKLESEKAIKRLQGEVEHLLKQKEAMEASKNGE